jgi:hypothetical protein
MHSKINFNFPNTDTTAASNNNKAVFAEKFLPFITCPSNPFSTSGRTVDGTTNFSGWDVPIQPLHYPVMAGSMYPEATSNATWPPSGLTLDCPSIPPANVPLPAANFCITHRNNIWVTSHAHKPHLHPGSFSARGVTEINMKDIMDGTSNTMILGERKAELCINGGAWSNDFPGGFTMQKPNSSTMTLNPGDWRNNCGFSSHHTGIVQFVFADGKVAAINDSIDHATYCYLGDKADNKNIGAY